MSLWYALCDALPVEMLHWDFMKNAFLALLLMAPLFGLMSTMVVTGKMSFFSDALGHSAFTGIAIGAIFGLAAPTWAAVIFSVAFALLFCYVRSRSNQAAETLIGVFSSSAVALGIFVATLNGGSFTKYNTYLIGDILLHGGPDHFEFHVVEHAAAAGHHMLFIAVQLTDSGIGALVDARHRRRIVLGTVPHGHRIALLPELLDKPARALVGAVESDPLFQHQRPGGDRHQRQHNHDSLPHRIGMDEGIINGTVGNGRKDEKRKNAAHSDKNSDFPV